MLTQKQAKRNPEEEGDYMAFEQLMADAAIKKDKEKEKKDKDKKEKKEKPAASEAKATA